MGMLVKEGLGKGKEGVMERLAKVEIEILRREKKNVEIEMGVEELAKRERLVREEIKVEMEMGVKKLAKIEIKRMKGKKGRRIKVHKQRTQKRKKEKGKMMGPYLNLSITSYGVST